MMQKTLSAIFLLLLAACGGPVISGTMNRYHTGPLEVAGKTYIFLPTEEQANSLEYQKYASEFAGNMALVSMYQRSALPADYGVEISYSVNEGPTPSGIGGSAGYKYAIGTQPVPGQLGKDGSPIPVMPSEGDLIYTRQMSMRLLDLATPDRKVVFEGKIYSSGWRRELVSVSGCLIPALFDEFPGEHGETIKFAVPSGECVGEDAEEAVKIDQ